MSYQVDSYGNAYFPAGVSVASIPATTGTQNKVLVPGPGGRISSASIAQLITQSGGSLVSSVFGRTGVITAQQGDYNTDQVTEGQALYFSDGRARKAITLTTFNTSGPATYDSTTGIINIPQYGSGIVGSYVPVTRTITINGQTADLSANRIFTIDAMVYPSVGIPISNGTAWGTSIVNNSTNWNTAYSWGNHALAGYLTSFTETDPTVPSHVKAITTTNISNWGSAYTWGNHALAGYLTSFTETDPIWTSEKVNYYTKIQADARYLQSYTEIDPIWTSEKANYALKTYVDTSISNLIDAAPTTLNTLNELAAALGDDANFSTSITTLIGTKEPAITPGTTAQYWRGDKTWQALPIYTLSGLGGVPTSRTLTINGTSYDLSADRSWSITSMIYPSAGIAVSTGSSWGTSITDNSTNWNTAYGWGNHASAGYLTTATAASTYLTQSAAATIYLTITNASNTYLTQSGAASIYLTSSNASSTYLTQSGAASIYLTQTNASNTYASLSGAYSNPAFVASLAWSKITGAPAFITGYTETDTLASVTGRGASTNSSVRFGTYADILPTGSAFRFYDGTTFRGGFGLDSWGHSGSDANLVLYVNGDNTLFFSTSGTKRASLSSSAFNSLVALQQSGNQVLHAGNYSSYAFPASGGTLNGYLTVSANWATSPYTSALTIIGTYPSITFRGSNSDWEWLQHVDSVGNFHFYGGAGYTANNWSNKLSIKTSGQLILKNHSTADSGYDNPLWIWATADSDAIVIQNTTSGGNAPKIYFRDTNGIIQTGNSEIRLRTSNSNSYSAYLSGGDWYATGSMRAPIFYDSNNTSYYVDPDSTSNVNAITMAGTLAMYGGAYYGTITFGTSSYWRAGISQRDAGNAELRIWAKGGGAGSIYFATGFDGEASSTTLPSDGMALKNNNLGLGSWGVSEFPSYKLHVKGTAYATSDMRAPIFYDSNDTAYYVDPNGQSVLSTVRTAIKAATGLAGYGGGSWVTDFSNTPVSSMTFGEDKSSGGPSGTWWFQLNMRHQNSSNLWGTQLAFGWEDNANRLLQRNVTGGNWSSWVEYINSNNIGSQSVSYASTAGSANSVAWGNVSGRPSALSQFSNDSGYITSSGNAASSNVATYARRIDGVSRVQITVGGNASTFYPVALYTGAGSTTQQYSEFVIERGGYDDPGYTGVGFSTFNARFSYKPSGWGYEAKYWNLEQLGQTTTMLADYDDYYQASQFVVWLRGGTTYWIWAIVGGISVVFENTSGTSYNATYRTFGTTTSVAARASTSRNFYGNLRVDNNIYSGGSLISGYTVELGGSDAGNVVLTTYNNRNLRLTGTGGTDVGICGRRSGGSFGFQLYGEGTAYGFLNYEWGAWNLKKVISGALYMNDNNSYYINTTGDSSFSGALSLGGALTVAGVSTLNGQVYINRHIDANTSWGSCGCSTIFVGWSTSKVVIGNGNSGGHDYANGLGSNSVVSTNPFYCYQDITAYSDSRVKENVEVIEDAVEKVKAIRGVTFTRNDVEDLNKRHAGVIAQEILQVLPEAVSEDSRGHLSVAYGNLTSLLIEAIKEQQLQIEELKNEIKELKNK